MTTKNQGGDLPVLKRVPVSGIDYAGRHRRDMGDIEALANSIDEIGLLQPIVITASRKLVAGERRLLAFISRGWPTIPAYIVSGLDEAAQLLIAERDENTCRKEFTPSEAVSLGKTLEALEKPKARERQKAGTNQHSEGRGKLPQGSTGRTREKIAEVVGMSGQTYAKAKKVIEAAEADPVLLPIVEEMDSTGKVDPAYKKATRRTKPESEDDDKLDLQAHLEGIAGHLRKEVENLAEVPAEAWKDLRRDNPKTVACLVSVCDAVVKAASGKPRYGKKATPTVVAEAMPMIKECIDILKSPIVGRQTTLALGHLGEIEKMLARVLTDTGDES